MHACWDLPADEDAVSHARRLAVQFAGAQGCPERMLHNMALAISEAVTNTVLHAFRTLDRPGSITVSVHVGRDRHAEVIVRDDGIGMSPRDDSPGLGFGLALIERMAEQTAIRTPPNGRGCEVWMKFRCDASATAKELI